MNKPITHNSLPISEEVLARIRAERGKVYGDPNRSHANIGLAWTGLIQQHYGIDLSHPIPSWLVSLMMDSFKSQRAARVYHEDNYVDKGNYARFAQEAQQCDPNAAMPGSS